MRTPTHISKHSTLTFAHHPSPLCFSIHIKNILWHIHILHTSPASISSYPHTNTNKSQYIPTRFDIAQYIFTHPNTSLFTLTIFTKTPSPPNTSIHSITFHHSPMHPYSPKYITTYPLSPTCKHFNTLDTF